MNYDVQLVHEFAATGNPDLYHEIIRRYAGFVYAACLRILGDRPRAEEATQDTFLRLHRHAAAISESVGGWLHTAATRISLNMASSDAARKRREQVYCEGVPAVKATWSGIAPELDEALCQLPEDLRLLLVAHYLEGRTQGELAHAVGLSQATVSRRLDRGVELLRQQLLRQGFAVAVAVLASGLGTAAQALPPFSLLVRLGVAAAPVAAAGASRAFRVWRAAAAVAVLGVLFALAAPHLKAAPERTWASPAAALR